MNHAQKALRLLADAVSDECVKSPVGFDAATLMTQRAQVQATLALVDAQNRAADELAGIREQARIANIIELHAAAFNVDGKLFQMRGIVHDVNGNFVLDSEIAEALGLGDTK